MRACLRIRVCRRVAASVAAGGEPPPPGCSEYDDVDLDVRYSVRVSAGVPWPLASSVETIMADSAQVRPCVRPCVQYTCRSDV